MKINKVKLRTYFKRVWNQNKIHLQSFFVNVWLSRLIIYFRGANLFLLHALHIAISTRTLKSNRTSVSWLLLLKYGVYIELKQFDFRNRPKGFGEALIQSLIKLVDVFTLTVDKRRRIRGAKIKEFLWYINSNPSLF